MEIVESLFCDLLQKLRLWIPGGSETQTLSRDFWMPDHSCRVCYECDSPFSLFNRRHHCRVCGRIFCGRCTENTLRVVDGHVIFDEDGERVRVCNFCYRMKEDEKKKENYNKVVAKPPSPPLTPSSSSFSLSSSSTNASRSSTSSSSATGNTVKAQSAYGFRASRLDRIDPIEETSQRRISHPPRRGRRSLRTESPKGRDLSPNPYDFCSNRSDDDETDVQKEGAAARPRMFDIPSPEEEEDDSCLEMDIGGIVNHTYTDVKYILKPNDMDDENIDEECSLQMQTPTVQKSLSKRSMLSSDEYEGPEESVDESKIYAPSIVPPGNTPDTFDLENNPCVWDPPPREDEDDDLSLSLLDDDEDEEESGWVSSSNSDYRIREKPNASHEQKRAMRAVVEGHFRALVAQLLDGEGLEPDSWLEIVAALASQAASIIKPDMSKDGGMDPAGYVKVKCIASGRRNESYVVKGVVCKRNVAHRRMVSRYRNPRLLLLGGSLEYQRVPNQLSSLDTLLQQEKEHLSMTVSRIEAHQPNVMLVEKTISRQAQERLLAKDITFILNVKKPLLERISRCTGAEIVPAPDHLMKAKLGHCDYFHVEKFDENISGTGHFGKKSTKTLMFFEGCPRPLGCSVLLKGADLIELQKVKRVTQYAVFAAYQLALETSFLVDEGATVPDLSLKSPISLTLPEKASFSERSITTVPGFVYPGSSHNNQGNTQFQSNHDSSFASEFPISYSGNMVWNNGQRKASMTPMPRAWSVTSSCFSSQNNSPSTSPRSSQIPETSNRFFSAKHGDLQIMSLTAELPTSASSNQNAFGEAKETKFDSGVGFKNLEETAVKVSTASKMPMVAQHNDFKDSQDSLAITEVMASKDTESGFVPETQDANPEEFPPSPSDHQSILVSFTSSNLQKRAVCEKGRLLRIKYYGSFDKPLGKFLRENVFDASKTCNYCGESREMHLHCYMHRQGSLTISVRRNSNGTLSGEREGRIWMWHRCLKCMHVNNIPPATHRVHMSDAAWGLSFGKFLELSFSNHAAASRVASCGHSLHRDCLRFYGLGSMIACFRYAPIRVHSVYLPPSKLEFNNKELDGWLLNEVEEVTKNGTLFFAKAFNILREIEEQITIHGSGKAVEARRRIADYETLLKNEQKCFLAMLKRASTTRKESDRVFADILQLNATKRSLATLYYVWISRFISLNATLEMKKTIFRSSTVGDTSMLLGTNNVDFIDQYRMCPPDHESDKILASDVSEQVKCMEFQASENAGQEIESYANQDHGDNCAPGIGSEDNTNHIQQPHADTMQTEMVLHAKAADIDGCNLDAESVTNEDKKLPFSEVDDYIGEKSVLCYNILETDLQVRRTFSEGQFPIISGDLTYTFEAAWTGKKHAVEAHAVNISSTGQEISSHNSVESFDEASTQHDESVTEVVSADKNTSRADPSGNAQFSILYRQHIPNLSSLYASFLDLEHHGRLSLPLGINDTVVIVYDDEPTTVIAYAITSHQYYAHISDQSFEKDVPRQIERENSRLKHSESLSTESVLNHPLQSTDQINEPTEANIKDEHVQTGSKEGGNPQYSKSTHVKVSFTDAEPQGKILFTVTCYYAKEFDALRKTCCSDPMEFIRSLCHCKRWGAQGGKSNVFFAKTQDDRFVIKQVTKTELESFIKFAPQYFNHLSDSVKTGSPTCLAKILGVYQVTIKHTKGGRDIKMDLMAMENLLYGRHVNRLYDLKGSLRSRYNADKTGENKVLLDENLVESMATHPIFIGNKAKRILERAIWNDTSFLANVDVMDYSLLVGVDEERQELVLGIIDFMRQYTWDKHLETWVKASGILGGPKNAQPTVISPEQYKRRFRKAMLSYFLMVPDQWSPTATIYGPPC